MFTCPVCGGDAITDIVYIDQLQANCLDCGAHLQQRIPDKFVLIDKRGTISGSEINKEHRIHRQRARGEERTMSDKRRRIIIDIWMEDRTVVKEYYDQLAIDLQELIGKGASRYEVNLDLFASERPLIGDSDHPMNQRRKNNA